MSLRKVLLIGLMFIPVFSWSEFLFDLKTSYSFAGVADETSEAMLLKAILTAKKDLLIYCKSAPPAAFLDAITSKALLDRVKLIIITDKDHYSDIRSEFPENLTSIAILDSKTLPMFLLIADGRSLAWFSDDWPSLAAQEFQSLPFVAVWDDSAFVLAFKDSIKLKY